MAFAPDMKEGAVTGRILQALRTCEEPVIKSFIAEGKLRTFNRTPILVSKGLKLAALDAYAEAARTPLCFFFYGTLTPPVPGYTENDASVITMLNSLPERLLTKLIWAVHNVYDNTLIRMDAETLNERLIPVIVNRFSFSERRLYQFSERQAREEVIEELVQFDQHHRYPLFRFQTDLLPEIAAYLGVSLHWLLNIQSTPMFCRSHLADTVFDYYTLLEPRVQRSFLELLILSFQSLIPVLPGKENGNDNSI